MRCPDQAVCKYMLINAIKSLHRKKSIFNIIQALGLIKLSTAHKNKNKKIEDEDCSCFKLSNVVLIMQINVKMPTIFGILTFMSMVNFMLI